MKISTLSIIAGAMTAFGQQLPSPFGALSDAVDAFDIIWEGWGGLVILFPVVVVGVETLETAINATCHLSPPLQSESTQMQWLQDGKTFINSVGQAGNITIDQLPKLDQAFGPSGRDDVIETLQDFEDQVDPCFGKLRSAFSAENQPALDEISDEVSSILRRTVVIVGTGRAAAT